MSTTRRSNILHVLSYFAVVFVGVALLLSVILSKINVDALAVVANALNVLAQLMAYIVIIAHSFGYARSHGTWWLVAWAVAVVLIVVFFAWGSISLFN